MGPIPETERNVYVEELTERLRQEGKKPFVVENGATSVHAAVGYFHLPIELVNSPAGAQIHDLFVPGGNGGTAQPFWVHPSMCTSSLWRTRRRSLRAYSTIFSADWSATPALRLLFPSRPS